MEEDISFSAANKTETFGRIILLEFALIQVILHADVLF